MIEQAAAPAPETPAPPGVSTGRPIIVLGMSRSGTSLVGDLVHRWGAYGGDVEALRRRNPGNPSGYFENPQMQRFIASELGLDFWTPSYLNRLRERARDPECRRRAQELVAGMTVQGPAWFWKEPDLSITLPFWKQIWGDAVYVIPVRNPYDSAVSWQKLRMPELGGQVQLVAAGLLEWQYFMRCILEEMEEVPNKLFLSYEELVALPREQCKKLCDFLDEHRGGGLQLADDRFERMVAAVDPALYRTRSSLPFSDQPDASPEQKGLYDFLLRKLDEPALEFVPAAYPIYTGWREYLAVKNYVMNPLNRQYY